MFNNGLLIIHGLQGYISPLSPFSCDVERMTSLSFQFHQDFRGVIGVGTGHQINQYKQQQIVSIMRFVLRDSMRFMPDQFMTIADMKKLLVGITLMTLDPKQNLIVITAEGIMKNQLRVNYVTIKAADMIKNLNVIVHSLIPHRVTRMCSPSCSRVFLLKLRI